MTTVAYRDGVLAADSLISRCGNDAGRSTKVRRVGDLLVAGCGTTSLIQRFISWVVGGMKGHPPTLQIGESTACVVAIHPDGWIVEWNGDHPPDMIRAPFAAWGSGADIALGAMGFGASAREAVAVAAKIDHNTGGEVQSISVRRD